MHVGNTSGLFSQFVGRPSPQPSPTNTRAREPARCLFREGPRRGAAFDAVQEDPRGADGSISQLRAQALIHTRAINGIVDAELSLSFSSLEALNRVVARLVRTLHEIPQPARFLAGKAFAPYRRQGGTRTEVLPEFFIGAHAAVCGWPLLTRDAARYRRYFPSLQIVSL